MRVKGNTDFRRAGGIILLALFLLSIFISTGESIAYAGIVPPPPTEIHTTPTPQPTQVPMGTPKPGDVATPTAQPAATVPPLATTGPGNGGGGGTSGTPVIIPPTPPSGSGPGGGGTSGGGGSGSSGSCGISDIRSCLSFLDPKIVFKSLMDNLGALFQATAIDFVKQVDNAISSLLDHLLGSTKEGGDNNPLCSIKNGFIKFMDCDVFYSTNRKLTYDNKIVQDYRTLTSGIAYILLAVVLIVGGIGIMINRHIGVQGYSAKEYIPRVMLGACAVVAMPFLTQKFIELNNVMCLSILGHGMPDLPGDTTILGASPGKFILGIIFFVGIDLTMGIMAIALFLQYFMRYAVIDLLLILAPFAALSIVHPATQGIFKMWQRAFFATVFVQTLQVLGINIAGSIAEKVFHDQVEGGDPVSMSAVYLIVIFMMLAVIKIPRWVNSISGTENSMQAAGVVSAIMMTRRQLTYALSKISRKEKDKDKKKPETQTGPGTGKSAPPTITVSKGSGGMSVSNINTKFLKGPQLMPTFSLSGPGSGGGSGLPALTGKQAAIALKANPTLLALPAPSASSAPARSIPPSSVQVIDPPAPKTHKPAPKRDNLDIWGVVSLDVSRAQPRGKMRSPNTQGWINGLRNPMRNDEHVGSFAIRPPTSSDDPGGWIDRSTGERGTIASMALRLGYNLKQIARALDETGQPVGSLGGSVPQRLPNIQSTMPKPTGAPSQPHKFVAPPVERPEIARDFAEARLLTPETLVAFGVEGCMYKDPISYNPRPALIYPTPLGEGINKVKFTDKGAGGDIKYRWGYTHTAQAGDGHPHLYGLAQAKELINSGAVDTPNEVYLVNGEPSVWAAYQASVPAICLAGGEGGMLDDSMLSQLKDEGFTSVNVVYDNDDAGHNNAPLRVAELEAAGFTARALDIGFVVPQKGADVDDLHQNLQRAGHKSSDLGTTLKKLPTFKNVKEGAK